MATSAPPVAAQPVAAGATAPVKAAEGKAAGTGDLAGKQDVVHLADAAKCKVYICFEGTLGAHLKAEVREKLWKGEYVEIFQEVGGGEA